MWWCTWPGPTSSVDVSRSANRSCWRLATSCQETQSCCTTSLWSSRSWPPPSWRMRSPTWRQCWERYKTWSWPTGRLLAGPSWLLLWWAPYWQHYHCRYFTYLSVHGDRMKFDLTQAAAEARWEVPFNHKLEWPVVNKQAYWLIFLLSTDSAQICWVRLSTT